MKNKLLKKLNKDFLEIVKKNQKITWPKAENLLLILLLSFCALFGVVMLGLGEQIKNEIDPIVYKSGPVINRGVANMVAGTPMEKMVPFLSTKDEQVASYLVAIAKKESNWGKFSPKKEGKECFNYWGYRGSENQTASGYSCFSSPRQAIKVVGERIAKLIEQKIDTPSEMIVWKCGRSCESHDPVAVAKWIQDVDYYYKKLYN